MGPSPRGTRLRIVWVTNVAAPYRHPVWAAMGREAVLEVGLLADNEPNRRWNAELPAGVPRLVTKALALHRGELHLYLLLRPTLGGRPDVVILPGWEMPASWQLLIEAKLRRIPTVAFYESSKGSHRFRTGPVALARRFFFRSVDAVVTVGEASTKAVIAFGVSPKRVMQTDNAVDVATLHAAARGSGPEYRHHRYVYVGQLIRRKNVDGVLDALAAMPDSARLVIAGEGPEADTLRAYAAELGIASRVEFRGYVPYEQIPHVLAEAATLVLGSRSEVYGLVALEALAAGLHVVVAVNCGVYADVQGLEGVFAADPSPDSLAAAMLESAKTWTGPIAEPAILARTPGKMADEILRACAFVRR